MIGISDLDFLSFRLFGCRLETFVVLVVLGGCVAFVVRVFVEVRGSVVLVLVVFFCIRFIC